jgi:hypothetical protein
MWAPASTSETLRGVRRRQWCRWSSVERAEWGKQWWQRLDTSMADAPTTSIESEREGK